MRVHPQPRDSWVGVPFPPLVDEETWERARALRVRRRTRSPRNTRTFHLLQHLVRCSECGMLMGANVVRRQSVRRGGKTYTYDLDPPRRYQCYGMRPPYRLRCREHPTIRAERLEGLVWGEVKRVLEHPDLIAAGLSALDAGEGDGVAGAVARTERELAGVQAEEDRAIRLYVTAKITEEQLDHQRRFTGERLERLRARLDEYRERESAQAGRRVALEQVVEWARRVGDGLDALSDEERREVLDLLLEEATIDGENRVTLTLAIPADEEFVLIAKPEPTTPSTPCGRRHGGPGASARPSPSRSSSWPTGTPCRRKPSSSWRRSSRAPSPWRVNCPRTVSPPTVTTSCSPWRGRSSRAKRARSRGGCLRQAQQVAADAEALLVDADWVTPAPVAAEEVAIGSDVNEVPERQRSLFSWAEFLAEEPTEPTRRSRRPKPASTSLFQWHALRGRAQFRGGPHRHQPGG